MRILQGLGRFAGALVVAALAAAPAPAQEKRIALVLGNAAYPEAPLRNPVNDARAMAKALRERGFEVILRENANRAQMADAVADFGEKLTEGSTALFFFAGHGIQAQGRNYLIPVDARISSEQRVRLEALDVEAVLDQTSAARARVAVVILDACRNNPFERRFRSTGGGLAQISAPEGTLIAYATAPGKVAADGAGANGLYTAELLTAMAMPGLKVEDVFKQVRVNVGRASNGAQIPWEASSLTGDFYFQAAVAAAPQPAPVAPAAPVDREAMFWDSVKGSTNPREFEAYLQRFPDGTFAPLAKARLDALQAAATPAASRPSPAASAAPPPAPPPAARPATPPPASAPAVAPSGPSSSAPQVAAAPPAARPLVGVDIPFRAPAVGTQLRAGSGYFEIVAVGDRTIQTRNSTGQVLDWIGGFLYGSQDGARSLDPEKVKAIWPLSVGRQVTFQVTRPSGGVWDYTLRVERFERIKIAAGEFDCAVVTLEQKGFRGYNDLYTFWYAQSVGFWVKRTWEWRSGDYPRPPPDALTEISSIVRP